MYHSIDIGSKNTWEDWHLIPSSRPVINPPKPNYYLLDVPGASGAIDLTENLFGEITYDNREGSWEFYVDNDHEPWDIIYSKILNYLHGKKFIIILEDELSYFYEGRVSVNEWRSDPNWSKITLDYIIDPFKYERNVSGEDWEWDPFDFENGVIYDKIIQIEGTQKIPIEVAFRPIIPVVYAYDDQVQVTYNKTTYTIMPNTEKTLYDFYLKQGKHELTFSGNSRITIKYRNGVL